MVVRRWVEMRWPEFAALGAAAVAILPVAAIEQHGPHLPVMVDACINEHLLERALALVPEAVPVVALPMQTVGKSDEHQAFPGTLTLRAETLGAVCLEIGRSVHRAGLRRLVLVNSHGGQPQVLDIVVQALRVELGMLAVNAAWSAMGTPDGLFSAAERRHGIHAGEAETSLMLHFRPDLVRMELAEDFVSASVAMEQEYARLTPEGRVKFGWMIQDLHKSGACGNAKAATAEKGYVLAEHRAAGFAELLEEIARYPLEKING